MDAWEIRPGSVIYMEDDADFMQATRRLLFKPKGPDNIPGAGRSAASTPERHVKTKVTMNLDGDIIAYFKEQAREDGRPYQSLINQVLREYIDGSRPEKLAERVAEILLSDRSFHEEIYKKLRIIDGQ